MENANPVIFESASARPFCPEDEIDDVHDEIDSREVFGEPMQLAHVLVKLAIFFLGMWSNALVLTASKC